MSYCSMTLPFTAAAPRRLTEDTCAPAMLTSAEVISMPDVDWLHDLRLRPVLQLGVSYSF